MGMGDWKKDRKFVAHPDAERFDRVTVETVERWKESELSGDEWRFSYVVTFWRHGQAVATISAGSVEDALLQAAAKFRTVKTDDGWMGDLSEVCCHPGCDQPWTILYHPIHAYAKGGEQLVRDPYEGHVRGFCERHKHRGDCALDDAMHNYVEVETRFPPDWNKEDR